MDISSTIRSLFNKLNIFFKFKLLNIKMCNLSWAEKYGIRLVFGKVPDSSIEDAMQDFFKV